MEQISRKRDAEELRGAKWDNFWSSAWIWGAAVALVLLIALSKVIIL